MVVASLLEEGPVLLRRRAVQPERQLPGLATSGPTTAAVRHAAVDPAILPAAATDV